MADPVRIRFPPRLEGFFSRPARYRVAYGGRGGAKSWAFARALLLKATQQPLRVLCARELQVSLADSVHRLLCDQIDALGLGGFFDSTKGEIKGANGSRFLFTGLRHNVTRVKSLEGVDVCWVEEAEVVSEESWSVLIPTIRKPGSEIWVSFNPGSEHDPTYRRFITSPPPGSIVVKIGWEHNPWLPAELAAEKDYLYRVDPEAAAHVWGGEPRNLSDAQVLRGRYRVEPFEPQSGWGGPYYGADWGFATDPTALVRCWIDAPNRTLYVDHEAYGVGVEIDQTPALFRSVPDAERHTIRADNARPETIAFMQRHGFPRIVAAAKGAGSVEDGVEHLRSYAAIVIHPRCKHVAEEARLWSYKTDRLSGDVLPILVDRHNHTMDALRYALEPVMRARGTISRIPGAIHRTY